MTRISATGPAQHPDRHGDGPTPPAPTHRPRRERDSAPLAAETTARPYASRTKDPWQPRRGRAEALRHGFAARTPWHGGPATRLAAPLAPAGKTPVSDRGSAAPRPRPGAPETWKHAPIRHHVMAKGPQARACHPDTPDDGPATRLADRPDGNPGHRLGGPIRLGGIGTAPRRTPGNPAHVVTEAAGTASGSWASLQRPAQRTRQHPGSTRRYGITSWPRALRHGLATLTPRTTVRRHAWQTAPSPTAPGPHYGARALARRQARRHRDRGPAHPGNSAPAVTEVADTAPGPWASWQRPAQRTQRPPEARADTASRHGQGPPARACRPDTPDDGPETRLADRPDGNPGHRLGSPIRLGGIVTAPRRTPGNPAHVVTEAAGTASGP